MRSWWTAYKGMAFSVAYRVLKNADQAEEAAHETSITAYTRLDRLARPDRFGAWVAVIVRNQAITTLRRQGRAPESLDTLMAACPNAKSAILRRCFPLRLSTM